MTPSMRRWRWHGMRTWLSPATTVTVRGSARQLWAVALISNASPGRSPSTSHRALDPPQEWLFPSVSLTGTTIARIGESASAPSSVSSRRAVPSRGFARQGGFRQTGSGSPCSGMVTLRCSSQPFPSATTMISPASTGAGISKRQSIPLPMNPRSCSISPLPTLIFTLSIGQVSPIGKPTATCTMARGSSVTSSVSVGAVTPASFRVRIPAPLNTTS